MAGKSYFGLDVPEIVIKSIFTKYDKDRSGCLEKGEILAMLGDMGLNKKQAELCFMLVDKDGNKTVCLNELLQWFSSSEGFKVIDDQNRYNFVVKAAKIFKTFDKDANGIIDKAEFKALLASVSKEWSGCDDTRIEQALKTVDKDNNGTVSFSEFLNWLEKKHCNKK